MGALLPFSSTNRQQSVAANPTCSCPVPRTNITLLISDSTEIGCELLHSALSSANCGLETVGDAVTCEHVVNSALMLKPHVALVSIALRDGSTAGLLALKKLRTHAPTVRCIVLMDKRDSDRAVEALCSGARGVFLRDDPLHMLLRCIRAVHDGQIWISNADLCRFIEIFSQVAPRRLARRSGRKSSENANNNA